MYVTLIMLLALVVLMVATSGEAEVMSVDTGEDIPRFEDDYVCDGVSAAHLINMEMDNLIWFLLPIFVLVAVPMFSDGTVKNGLSSGMSRAKLYFAKLIFSSILCVIMVLFYMASGIATATVLRGFGGPPPDGYWSEIGLSCAAQLLVLLAMNAFGIFLAFVTRREAAVISIYCTFGLVPPIALMAFSRFDFAAKLSGYIPLNSIASLSDLNTLSAEGLFAALVSGAVLLVASVLGGHVLFQKAEIK